jgi:hypothetical protein
MKKYFLLIFIYVGCVFITTPIIADMLVNDIDPPDFFYNSKNDYYSPDNNPQYFDPDNPETERKWLEALLRADPGEYIYKFEIGQNNSYSGTWRYAVLKYGVGQPGPTNPDHWAIMDDGDFILELDDISGLPYIDRLSHVTYFVAVPEPGILLLLGLGLSAVGIGSRYIKKIG